MPHHKSAIKRLQLNEKKNKYNNHYRTTLKTMIKKILSITDKEEANAILKKAYSLLDKLVNKKIIHKNNAGNKKARLAKFANSL